MPTLRFKIYNKYFRKQNLIGIIYHNTFNQQPQFQTFKEKVYYTNIRTKCTFDDP